MTIEKFKIEIKRVVSIEDTAKRGREIEKLNKVRTSKINNYFLLQKVNHLASLESIVSKTTETSITSIELPIELWYSLYAKVSA